MRQEVISDVNARDKPQSGNGQTTAAHCKSAAAVIGTNRLHSQTKLALTPPPKKKSSWLHTPAPSPATKERPAENFSLWWFRDLENKGTLSHYIGLRPFHLRHKAAGKRKLFLWTPCSCQYSKRCRRTFNVAAFFLLSVLPECLWRMKKHPGLYVPVLEHRGTEFCSVVIFIWNKPQVKKKKWGWVAVQSPLEEIGICSCPYV